MIHHLDCEKCDSLRAELMGKESTDLCSAKEVAVDHFMKCKHKTTVTLDEGTPQKEWAIGPLTARQYEAKPPQIRKGKKFANLEYKFWPTKLGRMWLEEKVIGMSSEKEFRSEILNAMNDLEKKIDSDVQKAPKGTPLDVPQSMDNAKKKVLSIAFRNLIGEIRKYGKKESLPLEKLRPEILAIKDALELMKLARKEFGEEMNEGLRVLRIEFSRVIGEINKYGKKESLPLEKLRPEILAIKDTLELIRLAREEFGKKIREDLERKLRSELDALIAGESLVENEKKEE